MIIFIMIILIDEKNRIKNDDFHQMNVIIQFFMILSFEYDKYNINFSINYDEKFINEIYIEIKDKK